MLRALILAALLSLPVAADPLVIRNDRGGEVVERLAQIMLLQSTGQSVEIRGQCMSSCTMLLVLERVCVAPDARLGFHGPSSYGRALDAVSFNEWSRVIASHYPPAVAKWYMSEARFRIRRLSFLSGRELTRHGVRECRK